MLKKVLTGFHFPMIVKALDGRRDERSRRRSTDAKEFAAAVAQAQKAEGKKVTAEPVSCDFTKENFAAKPDLTAPGADEAPEEEFCDNCGRQMVLKNGPWGPFMSCPGYSDDPPCKTIRKLTQKVQTQAAGGCWKRRARSAASRCCSGMGRTGSSSRARVTRSASM